MKTISNIESIVDKVIKSKNIPGTFWDKIARFQEHESIIETIRSLYFLLLLHVTQNNLLLTSEA